MNRARSRAIFIAALLISLLVHLVLAGYFRWPFLNEEPEVRIAQVRITRIARMAPHTPRPSPPPPVPATRATPRVRAIRAPVIQSQGRGHAVRVSTVGVARQSPAPVTPATASPSPAASPAVACSGHADVGPAVASTPDAAPISEQARASKVSGTAAIQVQLDADGHVVNAAVAQSSGNAGLDASALTMARNALYTPKYVNCKAVAGEYTFTVQFAAW